MAVDVGGALTRKIGPLPAWGWGIAVGGAALGVKMISGGGGGDKRTIIEVPTGAPAPGGGDNLAGELGTALFDVRTQVGDLVSRIDDLETMPGPSPKAPDNQQPNPKPTPIAKPKDAPETARLKRLKVEVVKLRKLMPTAAKLWRTATGLFQKAGETNAEQERRVAAEVLFLRREAAAKRIKTGSTIAMMPTASL